MLNFILGFYTVVGFFGFLFLVGLFGLNIGLASAKVKHTTSQIILIAVIEFILSLLASIFWPIGYPIFIMYFLYEFGKQARS